MYLRKKENKVEIVEEEREDKRDNNTRGNSFLFLGIVNSRTVPVADQEICRRLETYIASSTGEDAIAIEVEESIANSECHNVDATMSTIKTSNTTGTNHVLPALSRFKYEYFVAGISGGVVSTLTLHPLDLIKIRLAGEH